MKRTNLLFKLFSLAIVVAMLAGCAPAAQPTAAPAATEAPALGSATEAPAAATEAAAAATEAPAAPAGDRVLTIATPYGIGSLTPWISNSDGDTYVLSNVYETLVCDDTKDFKPCLAESWENEDDNTYVFKLRDNAYWQTGNDLFKDEKVQLTANDVKAVFDFVMDEANKSTEYADLNQYLKSVEVVDDFTIKFISNYPTSLLIRAISGVKIFPIKAIEENFDLVEQPVGSGAYIFTEYKADDHVTLLPNKDYYITPNLDKVVFKIIPDKAVAAIALQNGEVDIVPQILTTDLAAVANNANLVLLPNTVGWYRYLAFNTSHEMFQDPKVREAITVAIDFESIVNALFKNDFNAKIAVPAYGGTVPLEFEGADLDAWKANYVYDPAKAEQLLQEAGYVKGNDGIYAKDGKPLKFSIVAPTSDQNRIKFGDMAATYLKKIGIDAASVPTEWATMTANITSGNTEMFIMGGGSVLGGLNMLFNSKFNKSTAHNNLYVDPELDAAIDEAYATVDQEERLAKLKEVTLKIQDLHIHTGGYFEYVQIGMNKRVTDYDKSPTLWYGLVTPFRNVGVN